MSHMRSTSLQARDRIKASEHLINGLELDRLQAFTTQLSNKMPRVREAFGQLDEVKELELYDLDPNAQDLDYDTLSGFVVSMASRYLTAFNELHKFHRQDTVRQQEEKQRKLADIGRQESELRKQKRALKAKEAMLKRLRDAHRKEEEVLALDRKTLLAKASRLQQERRMLWVLGDPATSVTGTGAGKRKLSHEAKSEGDGDVKERLCAMNGEDEPQHIKRIKVEKDEPDENVEVKRSRSAIDEESMSDEETFVKRCRSEVDEESTSEKEVDVESLETDSTGSSELEEEIDTEDSWSEICRQMRIMP